jgi:hypothetical protein
VTSERPLTERERAACLHDLAGYRVLLAASRHEARFYAGCACKACRRRLSATKAIYFDLLREVQAEIETRIADIRALERDLEGSGT